MQQVEIGLDVIVNVVFGEVVIVSVCSDRAFSGSHGHLCLLYMFSAAGDSHGLYCGGTEVSLVLGKIDG